MTTRNAKDATANTESKDTAQSATILPQPILPEEMGVRTVASLFKVQEQTVKLWIKKGKLKARRDGLSWIISKDDLKEFYSANGR